MLDWVSTKYPGAAGRHSVEPVTEEYLPIGQGVAVVVPAAEPAEVTKYPIGAGVHVPRLGLTKYPASQEAAGGI